MPSLLRHIHRFLSCLLFGVVVLPVSAQVHQPKQGAVRWQSHIFSIEQGMLNRIINVMLVDSRGRVWAGSKSGLNLIQGNTVTSIYRSSKGLQLSSIDQILEDPNGIIWLLQLGDGNFSKFIETEVVGEMVFLDAAADRIFPHVDFQNWPAGLKVSDILHVWQAAPRSPVWLTLKNGNIIEYDGLNWKQHLIGHDTAVAIAGSLGDQAWWAVLENSTLEIRDIIGNLISADTLKGEWTSCKVVENVLFISAQESDNSYQERYWEGELKRSHLYYKKLGSPLSIIKKAGVPWDSYSLFSVAKAGKDRVWLSNDQIYCRFYIPDETWEYDLDRQGGIGIVDIQNTASGAPDAFWVRRSSDGLIFMYEDPAVFDTLLQGVSCRAMVMLDSNTLWLNSYSGVFLIDVKNRKPTWIMPAQTNGYGVTRLPDGTIWSGSHGDVVFEYVKDSVSGEWLASRNDAFQPVSGTNRIIYSPFCDSRNRRWGGTSNGLLILDGGRFVPFIRSGNRGHDYPIRALKEYNHELWACTGKGLVKVDTVKKQFYEWTELQYYDVLDFYVSPDGTFWLATYGNGLIAWTPDKGISKQFNRSSGLPDDVVMCVYPDGDKHLWLTTNMGLVRLEPASGAVQIFRKEDGLANDEFNIVAHIRLPDGSLYLGGVNGLTIVPPLNNRIFQKNVMVNLEKIIAFSSRENAEITHRRYPDAGDTIVLPSYLSHPQFQFRVLDSRHGGSHLIRYKIDESVFQYDTDGSLNLPQLNYGMHTLEVFGQGAFGQWSETPYLLFIQVQKPFYLKTWFWVLSALVLFLLFILILYFYGWYLRWDRYRLQLEVDRQTQVIAADKAIIVAQNEELSSLNAFKDRLFSLLAHDLRGPMTTLYGLNTKVQYLIKNERWEDIALLSRHIDKEIKGFELWLENLLFWSKSQKETLSLSREPLQVQALVASTLAIVQPPSSRPVHLWQMDISDHLTVHTDRFVFLVILRNVLDNASKFSDAEKPIIIRGYQQNNATFIEVLDEGIGIPADVINPERRTGVRGEKGLGLGLLLCRGLLEQQGGKLELFNRSDRQGACCRVILPAGSTDFKDIN